MSKLNFKDPAESALVNSKFLGRAVDDETTGIFGLNNVDSASGDAVSNTQRQLNENKFNLLADQTVSAAGVLLSDNISKFQIKRVEGNAAAVITASLPFGTTPDIQDGTIFYIIGKDDTNTVTIEHNDTDDGTLLNGNATLQRGFCLQLIWLADIRRFVDIGRNF